jgi:hypothetical protein
MLLAPGFWLPDSGFRIPCRLPLHSMPDDSYGFGSGAIFPPQERIRALTPAASASLI